MCMMSRLIVKNLPRKITKEKLRDILSNHGTITDVKLTFSKDGKFRRFGFVGFRNSEEAERAISYFNSSMILNHKVIVEECRDFKHHEIEKTKKNNLKNVPIISSNILKTGDRKEDVSAANNDQEEHSVTDIDFLNLKKTESVEQDGLPNDTKRHTQKSFSKIEKMEGKFSLRLQGAPGKLNEKQVAEFFHPVLPSSVTVLKGRGRSGAIVSFSNQKDLETSLKLNGDCIGGKSVKLKVIKNDVKGDKEMTNQTWQEKINSDRTDLDIDDVMEHGRIFIRNLAFICTEEDLESLLGTFGPLSEIHIPIDGMTKKNTGIAFATFMFPEHAVKALNDLDGTVFQGRMIHVLPAKAKPETNSESAQNASSYKAKKAQKDKASSQHAYNWNTLFIGTDAVAGSIAEKYNISKGEFLGEDEKESTAVRVALGETQIVQETRQFLLENGISLDSFSQPNSGRSKSVILAKNLPAGATAAELRHIFEPHGDLGRVLLAPAGITAVIEFLEPSNARQAFVKQAYRKFHHKPLFLEWAPTDVFHKSYSDFQKEKETLQNTKVVCEDENENRSEEGTTLFIKNLNFDTDEEQLRAHFEKCGILRLCTISKKKSHNKEELLSMGYGFVEYATKAAAQEALKTLQHSQLDSHRLELKVSNHSSKATKINTRKKQEEKKQTSSKILVRNVPFQADRKEIMSLFKTFGELKSIRLPKKFSTNGQSGAHRGFAFVDFITQQDAKKAFEALCHSTHLYGRRLVLEWAEGEEGENAIDSLRRKTAERYHGPSKKFKSVNDFEKTLL